MYFRLKTTPSGKVLQLLESYRNENGNPRQRVVVSLGNASIPKENQRDVAKGVEKHLYSYQELFPSEHKPEVQHWIDNISRRVDREGRWRPLQKAVSKSSSGEEQTAEEVVDGVLIDRVKHTGTTSVGSSLVNPNEFMMLNEVIPESFQEMVMTKNVSYLFTENVFTRFQKASS